MSGSEAPVIVVGAGIAGLAAAVQLASHGHAVTVIERCQTPGGKLREVEVAGQRLDAGPTVLTLRGIFDELFATARTRLEEHLTLQPVGILARHAWGPSDRLDLYADPQRSAEAIGAFAGPAEGRRFLEFLARARRTYETLEHSFIRAPEPSLARLVRHAGIRNVGALTSIAPFRPLWATLGDHFRDPRLRQLFGRYATYLGASPFEAPSTLMLLAHVEQAGVWLVEGGMHRVATALATLASRLGATLRYGSEVRAIDVRHRRACGVVLGCGEHLAARALIVNADASAIGNGTFGAGVARVTRPVPPRRRSLSAITWNVVATTRGFPLSRHTVFFSTDYAREFRELFRDRSLPTDPTVYVCAQDRDDTGRREGTGPERLLCLVNAPAHGDLRPPSPAEIDSCEQRTFSTLERAGLSIQREPGHTSITTPADFNRLFPGSGGALYGRASHGWQASFRRPGVRTSMPGLYLAGGSIHPGPGLPMAALSGRLAADALIADSRSTHR